MERNENGNLGRRSAVPANPWALSEWRSRMEHATQQRARELAQLHRTVLTMPDMLERHTAQQEVQWRGMKMCLEEKEEMWDTYQ